MKHRSLVVLVPVVALTGLIVIGARVMVGDGPALLGEPVVAAPSPVEAGRYLAVIGGCHDCHTPGWKRHGAAVPESEWLTGVPVGYRGPWGTSYARDLRGFMAELDEDAWVHFVAHWEAKPPMPLNNLRLMSESDLRAIHRYIRTLEPTGADPGPANVPPGEEPTTPYYLFDPQPPAGAED